MHEDDVLFKDASPNESLVLWLRVDGVEHPFDSTGHFPVLAGYDTSGREIFVAQAFFKSSDSDWPACAFSYVCDGACSVSAIRWDGKRRTTSRFDVMVLRHDPCVVRMAIPAGAKFQTGPVFWMGKEDHRSYLNSNIDSMSEYWVSESDSADSSSTDSEDGDEDELESTLPAPTHGFLEELELDDLRIPMAELQPTSHSESTTIESEEYRDAELQVDERNALAELQHVIEDQKLELEAQRQELEVQSRELDEQNRKLEEWERELEELRAFKSSRTGYDEGVTARECKAQE